MRMFKLLLYTRPLSKFHLFAKMILFGILIAKFFNHMCTYAFKIWQSICSKNNSFFQTKQISKEVYLRLYSVFNSSFFSYYSDFNFTWIAQLLPNAFSDIFCQIDNRHIIQNIGQDSDPDFPSFLHCIGFINS